MAKQQTVKDLELKLVLLRKELFKRELINQMKPTTETKKELRKLNELIDTIGEKMVKLEMDGVE